MVFTKVFMVGRYIVELIMILLCGMGLHVTEVARVGGSESFVRFGEVSIAAKG